MTTVSIRRTLAGAGVSGLVGPMGLGPRPLGVGVGTGWLVLEFGGEVGAVKRFCNCWKNCKVDSASAARRNCCCRGEGTLLG